MAHESATIAGKRYAHSIVGWSTYRDQASWSEYNVNYRCTEFRSSIGLIDESASGQTRAFSIRADDATTSLGSAGLGSAKSVSADISGVYRIRLAIGRSGNDNAESKGAFANPQVYCLTSPS
nr:NPCBM/NEW2 domain-containing protein [Leucobacter weissii]